MESQGFLKVEEGWKNRPEYLTWEGPRLPLLALETEEGSQTKKRGRPLETGKGKGWSPPPRVSRRNTLILGHLRTHLGALTFRNRREYICVVSSHCMQLILLHLQGTTVTGTSRAKCRHVHSLSHRNTHSHTHSHTHTWSHSHTYSHQPTLSLIHTLMYTLSHAHTRWHTLTFHTPPCTTQSLTHSCTYTLTPHKHTPSHMLSHKYTLIHTHTHTLVLKNEFIQLPWTLWNNTCGLFSVPRRTF